MPPKQLNLGCGSTKLDGYINIDVEESCSPDLVCDFSKQSLPYEDKSIDKVVLFHTIEHIRKSLHVPILSEIHRVLKVGACVIISYPNFLECVENWKNNKQGQRAFWEATIYGRQLYPSDYHVCIMDPNQLEILLRDIGFDHVQSRPEPSELYNSITWGRKIEIQTYKDLLAKDYAAIEIKK